MDIVGCNLFLLLLNSTAELSIGGWQLILSFIPSINARIVIAFVRHLKKYLIIVEAKCEDYKINCLRAFEVSVIKIAELEPSDLDRKIVASNVGWVMGH